MSDIVLLGAKGNLAKSLISQLSADQNNQLYVIDGESEGILRELESFLMSSSSRYSIINTIGIVDWQHCSSYEVFRVNLEFPKRLMDVVFENNAKLVTLGTIMEHFPDYCQSNPYLQSKFQLSQELAKLQSQVDFLHLRLHTLYGGQRLHPNLFLGQLFHSLRHENVFTMSGGTQLREYHHVDDESCAFQKLLDLGVDGFFDLSHGKPMSLLEIASNLAKSLGKLDLINVGKLDMNPFDNQNIVFSKSEQLYDVDFRDVNSGIHAYFISWSGQ